MKELKNKMSPDKGRKISITDQWNFTDIENPFHNSNFSMQTLKLQRHKDWMQKNDLRQTRVKGQIREMERKISLYDKYQKEQGLYFSEKDKNKLFGPQYDKAQMEMLISLKMF